MTNTLESKKGGKRGKMLARRGGKGGSRADRGRKRPNMLASVFGETEAGTGGGGRVAGRQGGASQGGTSQEGTSQGGTSQGGTSEG